MTLRLTVPTRKRLERLAKATARSKAFLAQEAIESYLDLQEWQVAAVERGLRDADEGRLLDDAAVDDWLAGWGTKKEKKAPR